MDLFLNRFARFWGTTCYTGYSPVGPGTVGSLVAFLPYILLSHFRGPLLILYCVVFFFLGVWASNRIEKETGEHDPGLINLDEVVGQWIALIALPASGWIVWTAAFVLFRAFDMLKPFPVNRTQSLPGGWGVMVDDVLAGIYANLILQIVFRII